MSLCNGASLDTRLLPLYLLHHVVSRFFPPAYFVNADSSTCCTPSFAPNHPTLSFVNCSTRGNNGPPSSTSEKSSTVPHLMNRTPGNPELTRNIKIPHLEQKWLVIEFPVVVVVSWVKVVRSEASPRTNEVWVSSVVKLEANMDAVSLRQS